MKKKLGASDAPGFFNTIFLKYILVISEKFTSFAEREEKS